MVDSAESPLVCVIGLGDMGSALAEALINNGHRVTVWNRTMSKCDPLVDVGASVLPEILGDNFTPGRRGLANRP